MRIIFGHNSKYLISRSGKVINRLTGKEIKPHDNGCGYMTVVLNKKNYYVHRLVAQTYIPNPENKRTVNHKDSIRTNNSVNNLEWMTHKENIRHSWLNKKIFSLEKPRPNVFLGEANGKCKLSKEQVWEIRKLEGIKNQYELAKDYNVTQAAIYKILRRINWKHI